ncbi:MAG: T9SS type A sorting domain-containing protein, partial [Candidatus Neomarinimicrobiota bacterium]
ARNYPNPFNPSTTIGYALPEAGMVTVKIYNLLGAEVATLANGFREAGRYSVRWQANNMSSGVYLVQMRAGDFSQTRKIMLMK